MARQVREEELIKQVLATQLQEWRNPHMLGNGAFGVTYRVKHVDGKPFGVIKVYRPHAAILKDFGTEEVLERFTREVKLLQSISHPRIPRLIDQGLRNDPPWFLMQYVPGPTIEHLIDNQEPLPEDRWFSVARDLLEALKYAHSKGAIHKDLNPQNVIIAPQGASLIDFGVAALVQDPYTPYKSRIGAHPPYMCPEQIQMMGVTGKSDVFSLASLLTFAGTGHHPWGADDDAMGSRILRGEPDYSGLTAAQKKLLTAMHKKSPSERVGSDEALALLESLYRPAQIGGNHTTQPVPTQRSATPVGASLWAPPESGWAARLNERLEAAAVRLEQKELQLKSQRVRLKFSFYIRPILGVVAGMTVLGGPLFTLFSRLRNRDSRAIKWLFRWSVVNFFTFGAIAVTSESGSNVPATAVFSWFAGAFLAGAAGLLHSMAVNNLPLAFAWRGSRALTPEQVQQHREHGRLLPREIQSSVSAQEQVLAESIAPAEPAQGERLRNWDDVRHVVRSAIEERRGKQFVLEMETHDIEGIFFQGYSEENGAVTIEAAADLSVRPRISDTQHQAMIRLGWEPPSDGLPNYIRFLELRDSSPEAVADLIIRTLRDGYGVTLDSLLSV